MIKMKFNTFQERKSDLKVMNDSVYSISTCDVYTNYVIYFSMSSTFWIFLRNKPMLKLLKLKIILYGDAV